jgi:hypothetical protein
MGTTQATAPTEGPRSVRRLDVTDFRTDRVTAFADRRDEGVFFERKGARTYLVSE